MSIVQIDQTDASAVADAFDERANLRDAFAHEVSTYGVRDLQMVCSPAIDAQIKAYVDGWDAVTGVTIAVDADTLDKTITCVPGTDGDLVYSFEVQVTITLDSDAGLISIDFAATVMGTNEDDIIGITEIAAIVTEQPAAVVAAS